MSAASITASAESVAGAVRGIDDACQRMPETRAWSGLSHEAAEAMFGRAERDASNFSEYANAVASALSNGSRAIGSARTALLNKADQVDQGPLNVTDQWVVLLDPVRMSAEELAKLQALAMEEQTAVNGLLSAVGDADDDTADAVVAAGSKFGFVESRPSGDPFAIPEPGRPGDEVPNPREVVGMMGQEAIRNGDEAVAVREVIEGENAYGEETTTVIMQDGSKQVVTRRDPFEWPSKQNFYTVEHFDTDGNLISETSSWHDMGNDCDYTSISWPDGSNLTMSMDPTGYRTAGFTTADGRHEALPVALIDQLSLGTTSGMTGLEKHLARGGVLPMVTAESLENIGKATKFGGPALGFATTVFDMAMADNFHETCVAALAGASSVGGGWGAGEFGAFLGTFTGPAAPIAVPAFAGLFALGGGYGMSKVGQFVGDVVCPY